MTVGQLRKQSIDRLSPIYGAREATWLTRILFEHIKGYSTIDIAIKTDDEISDFITTKFDDAIRRLLNHEPIQYIFNETYFYGLKLKVTRDTLIPRPETEELVDMIVNQHSRQSDLRVLDICTGSGCIAIALARNLRFPTVTAIDLSNKALDIARENALKTSTDIRLIQSNALSLPQADNNIYDIIVSNPPYITDSERTAMQPNVLRFEPSMALFVPDTDPLRFYNAIVDYACHALSDNGQLYFEINPLFANDLKTTLSNKGWRDVTLSADMQRRQRFIIATCPDR